MQTGLVLEGGGVRGIYTAGVLDVFMEQDIHFDGVIGVSAGAIHGCSYLSGQHGRSIRYYKNYCSDPRFMSIQSLIKTGDLVGVEFCYHIIPEQLDIYDNEAFCRCGVPFYATCSNVETGKAEYLRITNMNQQIDILRASASLPYVSRMVEIDGKKYLDGGSTDSIPVEAFRKMGYERNVVVLTQPASYRKKPELRFMAGIRYGKYPLFAMAQKNRHLHYNQTIERIFALEKEGSVLAIRPKIPLPIGRMEKNPDKVQYVYHMGREDALERMDVLKEFLNDSACKEKV